MIRRQLLAAVVLGTSGLALGGCSLFGAVSKASDAMAARLRTWLESDPRVVSIQNLVGDNYEGAVRARADVTLVTPLTTALVTDFMAAFFASAGSDRWEISVASRVAFSLRSTDDNAPVRSLPALWGHLTAEPGLSGGRVMADRSGTTFDVTVADDPVAHGLRLVGTDWAAPVKEYFVRGADTSRTCSYTADIVDPADVAALQRFAAAYRGSMSLTMRGTQRGELILRPPAADVDAVKALVAGIGVPSSFKVSYQGAPSASRS